jgi:hypothetical protein
VINRSHRLLEEIETGALDQKTPIATLLRKVIILGGQAGSEEMRGWASRELDGYGPKDELPPYRRFTAPLCVDSVNPRWKNAGQMITPLDLPEAARDQITNLVELTTRIAGVEAFARESPPDKTLKAHPRGTELALAIMNSHGENWQVTDLYWAMTPTLFGGVVDAVRTTLTKMVGELRTAAYLAQRDACGRDGDQLGAYGP